MNVSSHPSLLLNAADSSGRDTGRERLLKRPTSLFSQHCLRNAFLLVPLAPCVDALSAGCVLHVKQAADAVRKRDQEEQGGLGHKEAPLPCHPPGLALLPPPPQLPSYNTSHYFTPPQSPFSFPGSTCHPSITRSLHPPLDHPSATLLAHAVVRLLGNKLQWCMEAR